MREWLLMFACGLAMSVGAFTLPVLCGATAEYALSNQGGSGSFIGGTVINYVPRP